MSTVYKANIVKNNLAFYIDAANKKSYPSIYSAGTELVTDANLLVKGDGLYRTCFRDSVTNTPVTLTSSIISGKKYTVIMHISANRNTGQATSNLNSSTTNLSPSYQISIGRVGFVMFSFTASVTGTLTFAGDNTITDFDIDYVSVKELLSNTLVGQSIFDISGNNKTFSFSKGIAFNALNNGSMDFNGISSTMISSSVIATSTTAITASAWVKVDAHGNWNNYINNNWINSGWLLYSGVASWTFGVGVTSAAQYNANTPHNNSTSWTHLTGTYDGAFVRIYVNGVFKSSTALSNATLDTGYNILIGSSAAPGAHKIANSMVYNRALTATEIMQNFEATRGRFGI